MFFFKELNRVIVFNNKNYIHKQYTFDYRNFLFFPRFQFARRYQEEIYLQDLLLMRLQEEHKTAIMCERYTDRRYIITCW